MSSVGHFVLLYVLFVPLCNSLNICGLQDTPICSLGDTGCLQLLDKALRKWFQTPEAKGYFINPIDPLRFPEISFDVMLKKFTLLNVTITGLTNSLIEIRAVTGLNDIYKDTFTHNLQVAASNYLALDVEHNDTVKYSELITFGISNVKTVNDVSQKKVRRCDGTDHLLFDPQEIQVFGGTSSILSKNRDPDLGIDNAEFKEALLDAVARLSSEHLYREKAKLFSIVNYGEVFKDN